MIGKEVSIITNSNIRYEGSLISIDGTTQKLTVKSVKQFGTEGRNAKEGKQEYTPPNLDTIYPCVEFTLGLVKSIAMIEKPG